MKAVDTSVIVAAFASWHEAHDAARLVLRDRPALIAHCAMETYSVLTRLPVPHRAPPHLVAEFLERAFPASALALPGDVARSLPTRFAALGISGGAVYDALVACTASHHDAVLVTMDVRALRTYQQLGVAVQHLPVGT